MNSKFALICLLLGLSCLSPKAYAQLRTVAQVDGAQYVGTWYQIANNPMVFDMNCKCSRQVMTGQEDLNLGVYNTCTDTLTGLLREVHGTATPNDGTYAQYTVDFGQPWKGQYWIIGLANDYRYAVVSEPTMQSLFILSRTPTMTPEDYDAAVGIAAEQVAVGKLQITDQLGCSYPQ